MMDDIWQAAIRDATHRETILYTHELEPNMIVQRLNGQKTWCVSECLMPDGFPLRIVRMIDEKGYDDTVLFEAHGRLDERNWKLLGRMPDGWLRPIPPSGGE